MGNLSLSRGRVVEFKPTGEDCTVKLWLAKPNAEQRAVLQAMGETVNDAEDVNAAIAFEMVVALTHQWAGIDNEEGKAAPCDEAHKLAFYQAYPEAALLAWGMIKTIHDWADKTARGKAFGGGSASASLTPASVVDTSEMPKGSTTAAST